MAPKGKTAETHTTDLKTEAEEAGVTRTGAPVGADEFGEGEQVNENPVYLNGNPVGIGDRVQVVGERPVQFGQSAAFTVVSVGTDVGKEVGLQAPEPFASGHDCDGACPENTGWYVKADQLEPIAT